MWAGEFFFLFFGFWFLMEANRSQCDCLKLLVIVAFMRGASVRDGSNLSGSGHLKQCLVDVLRTPVGSRVMRPSYGSRLFFLLDRVVNELTVAEVIGAIVEAVVNCVPMVTPRQVVVNEVRRGCVVFDLSYVDNASGESGVLNGVEVSNRL